MGVVAGRAAPVWPRACFRPVFGLNNREMAASRLRACKHGAPAVPLASLLRPQGETGTRQAQTRSAVGQVREKAKPKHRSRFFPKKAASARAAQVVSDAEWMAWETVAGLLAGKCAPFWRSHAQGSCTSSRAEQANHDCTMAAVSSGRSFRCQKRPWVRSAS